MPASAVSFEKACRAGVVVVSPLFTSVSLYGGFFLVVTTIVVVGGVSEGSSITNISGI